MSMRTANDPFGCNTPLVDKMVGNAFLAVREVTDHLSLLKYIAHNMEALTEVVRLLSDPELLDRNYANDAAAAVGGVSVGGLYHNAGSLRIRLA